MLCEDGSRPPIQCPNVLWIYLKTSAWLRLLLGDQTETPNIDRLAKAVCGSIDSMNCGRGSARRCVRARHDDANIHRRDQHRSHRNVKIGDYVDSHDLPNGIKTIPQYFRDAGYYTFNDGKDDYNFTWSKDELYDSFGCDELPRR